MGQAKRKETLIGLSTIYYGLNDIEKSDYYKNELADLEGKPNDTEMKE